MSSILLSARLRVSHPRYSHSAGPRSHFANAEECMVAPMKRTSRKHWVGLGLICLLAACSPSAPDDTAAASMPRSADTGALIARDWALPAPAGAAQPDLVTAPGGGLLLSWIEPAGEARHRLRLARTAAEAERQAWEPAMLVAEGSKWFLNWADTPHVYALPDGSLWAHWLRSTGPARMDYGIDLVRSDDGGKTWSQPRLVHPAGTRGDHGFVTFWPQTRDQLGIAWLDSRQKSSADAHDAHSDDGHHGGAGAMMLRAALYGPQAQQQAEWPLDASTCDCCTTSSAVTARGAVVVYRGRDANEIRDTRIVRFDGQRWTPPRDVHADGWRIAGCPVNGPAVVADANQVWVAWYTEADGVPELRAARSDDAGDHFGLPVTLAKGAQVLGRVSLALGGGHVWAAWLEESAAPSQRLMLARYDLQWGGAEHVEVAELAARGRASGMPRMRWTQGAAWLVWTDVSDGGRVLKGATVR
jgi:hypothetical protein